MSTNDVIVKRRADGLATMNYRRDETPSYEKKRWFCVFCHGRNGKAWKSKQLNGFDAVWAEWDAHKVSEEHLANLLTDRALKRILK